jgi:hypothetical protein
VPQAGEAGANTGVKLFFPRQALLDGGEIADYNDNDEQRSGVCRIAGTMRGGDKRGARSGAPSLFFAVCYRVQGGTQK